MTVEILDCEQNSPEWLEARCGLVTASTFAKVLAQGKEGGASVGRRDLLLKLAGEILTGQPAPEGYRNADMDRGHEQEGEARSLYAFTYEPVQRVGFIRNGRKGASPDSLVGTKGGLEIKCAIPSVQIDRLLKSRLPPEHVAQVQGSLWVSEREHWDFMSYCPGLPPFIHRVYRDEPYIATLAKAVDAFNEELDSIVASIRTYENFARQAA
ncbi:MAG: hypothetical protein JWM16_6306 [Verrucomicrobiales bacterium]|nr:hypothetical protein [Verrucomicrobiales bacterium]